jgi:outer membrane protein OmpA-like peptidoglycan-associated protein
MEKPSFAKLAAAAIVVAIVTIPQWAGAQGNEQYMPPNASKQDYINALKKTRSIRPVIPSGKQQLTGSVHEQASAISVKVYFPYNSAELTDQAKAELDNLGAALSSSDFSRDRWQIEGHTDASGGEEYNQSLSTRRAMSVYNYLITKYGMRPDQLVPVGKGKTDLYDPQHPYAAVNRRVRITYLGG